MKTNAIFHNKLDSVSFTGKATHVIINLIKHLRMNARDKHQIRVIREESRHKSKVVDDSNKQLHQRTLSITIMPHHTRNANSRRNDISICSEEILIQWLAVNLHPHSSIPIIFIIIAQEIRGFWLKNLPDSFIAITKNSYPYDSKRIFRLTIHYSSLFDFW